MPATDNYSRRVSERRRHLGVVFFAILALLVVIGAVAFRNAGHWLVREDPLDKADAIVVLSGGLPFRAEGAAGVYKSGYAPAVWVSKPGGPQEELAALGIHFVGEEEYNRIPRYRFFRMRLRIRRTKWRRFRGRCDGTECTRLLLLRRRSIRAE
jgi:hypothetical protein